MFFSFPSAATAVLCPTVEDISFGYVNGSSDTFNSSLTLGCLPGFIASGPTQYVCESNNGLGVWMPDLSADLSSFCQGNEFCWISVSVQRYSSHRCV